MYNRFSTDSYLFCVSDEMRQTSESSLASTVSSASYHCDEPRPSSTPTSREHTLDTHDVMDFLDEAMSDEEELPPTSPPRRRTPERRTSRRQVSAAATTSPRGIVSIDSYRSVQYVRLSHSFPTNRSAHYRSLSSVSHPFSLLVLSFLTSRSLSLSLSSYLLLTYFLVPHFCLRSVLLSLALPPHFFSSNSSLFYSITVSHLAHSSQ